MKITYLGHSCFEIITNNNKIIIDPFLVLSPNYDYSEVKNIFVTHGHGDHLGNAIEISKTTKSPITTIFELANYCEEKGAYSQGINLGGWINFTWGRVSAVPAFHSSSTPDGKYAGCACGFIFDIEGKIIYHSGDTCLNQEMKTIKELYKPDISILPIGGHYTMDIQQAGIAAQWLDSSKIIPMHYNTFDAIQTDISQFEKQIKRLNKTPIILEVGKSIEY